MNDCCLYLISPPALDSAAIAAAALEAALDGGEVASFQLRLKETDADEIARAVENLMPIAHAHDVAFILNDDPALAVRLGCDGVHVGQDDMNLGDARATIGADAVVGVTCHDSRHLALQAAEGGADYVAFGAFFPTATKDPKASAKPEILTWWQDFIEIPCVAIGGITPRNCRPLVEAGADFLAVSAGVWNHAQGPAGAVAAFNEIFTAA